MGGGGGRGDDPGAAAEAVAEQGCSRAVCCIGDIHGFYFKLVRLWANLEARVGAAAFRSALVIFLGDYCDRGPQTREVIDFLISLPARYPEQTHVFLCGNHDLAFAAFVGALPPPPDGSPFSDTWGEYDENKKREGWYEGEGYEGMHLQGRRWAGKIKDEWNPKKDMKYMGSIYDAGPTFESYGVPHGSSELAKAVPEEHKKFLADLVWIHEEDNVCLGNGRVCRNFISVHAGLDREQPIDKQLTILRSRDTSISKVEQLSGRQNVWEIPMELPGGSTVIVSGHHGKLYTVDPRFIIDEGGGKAELPVAALMLPSQEIVRDTDELTS